MPSPPPETIASHAATASAVAPSGSDHLLLAIDQNFRLTLSFDWVLILAAIALAVATMLVRYGGASGIFNLLKRFDIDEAQLGVGDQSITLRPNDVDRQIAYKIWVELSTRKIGLPIDLEHDVIVEVYDSWHTFFTVTRELIKDVPVSRFRRKDTEQIIRLSIDLLNNGLRPHLTQWQARFRRWYEKKLDIDEHLDLEPQLVQAKFPHFEELQADLLTVNDRLMAYRAKMHEIVRGS